MKANGTVLPLSDIVSVGIYVFEEYETLEISPHEYAIVGHQHRERPFEVNRPIEPTEKRIVSDREMLDSILILASKALPNRGEKTNELIRSWCKKYGLPTCSVETSQQVGYLAFPLNSFYDFLFLFRDTFWKVESLYNDFANEQGIEMFDKNPYKRGKWDLPIAEKESLISDFVNETDLRLRFEYKKGTPTFYNYAADIVSLVKYQFALLLLSNSDSVPRRCKCCGSMFFAHRKNQLYGPCCTRQKRYAAERRKKEKEQKSDG